MIFPQAAKGQSSKSQTEKLQLAPCGKTTAKHAKVKQRKGQPIQTSKVVQWLFPLQYAHQAKQGHHLVQHSHTYIKAAQSTYNMSVMDSLMQSFFIWPLTCCLETRKCIFLYEFIFHVGLNCSTSFHNGNVLNWMGKIDHSSKVSQLLIYFTCFNQYVNNSVNLALKNITRTPSPLPPLSPSTIIICEIPLHPTKYKKT